MANQVDVLVIGGGPAGLGAAIMLSRTKRTVALFDSGVYRNSAAPEMHNVPAHDGQSPAQFRDAALQELSNKYRETFQYVKRRALALRKLESTDGSRPRFEVEDDSQQKWTGRKVILATGLQDRLPQIPGFDQIWGVLVVHCVFCHGTETAGKPIAVLLDPAMGGANGKMLSMFVQKFKNLKNDPVTIIANGVFKEGEEPKAAPDYGITDGMVQLTKTKGYRWELRAVTSVSREVHNPPPPMIDPNVLRTIAGINPQVASIIDLPKSTEPAPHPEARFNFSDGQSLTVPYVVHTPITEPSPSTLQLLSDPSISALKEGTAKPNAMFKMSMGEIPTQGLFSSTEIPGIFACGNASLFMATVNMSISLGQLAAAGADNEIGMEDEQAEIKALQSTS